jgi:predicted small metal-binding protein
MFKVILLFSKNYLDMHSLKRKISILKAITQIYFHVIFPSNTFIAIRFNKNMINLSCRESGLECDYIAEGKTEKEVLNLISEHALKVHNMKTDDMYDRDIPTAFFCQVRGKVTSSSSNYTNSKAY